MVSLLCVVWDLLSSHLATVKRLKYTDKYEWGLQRNVNVCTMHLWNPVDSFPAANQLMLLGKFGTLSLLPWLAVKCCGYWFSPPFFSHLRECTLHLFSISLSESLTQAPVAIVCIPMAWFGNWTHPKSQMPPLWTSWSDCLGCVTRRTFGVRLWELWGMVEN